MFKLVFTEHSVGVFAPKTDTSVKCRDVITCMGIAVNTRWQYWFWGEFLTLSVLKRRIKEAGSFVIG